MQPVGLKGLLKAQSSSQLGEQETSLNEQYLQLMPCGIAHNCSPWYIKQASKSRRLSKGIAGYLPLISAQQESEDSEDNVVGSPFDGESAETGNRNTLISTVRPFRYDRHRSEFPITNSAEKKVNSESHELSAEKEFSCKRKKRRVTKLRYVKDFSKPLSLQEAGNCTYPPASKASFQDIGQQLHKENKPNQLNTATTWQGLSKSLTFPGRLMGIGEKTKYFSTQVLNPLSGHLGSAKSLEDVMPLTTVKGKFVKRASESKYYNPPRSVATKAGLGHLQPLQRADQLRLSLNCVSMKTMASKPLHHIP